MTDAWDDARRLLDGNDATFAIYLLLRGVGPKSLLDTKALYRYVTWASLEREKALRKGGKGGRPRKQATKVSSQYDAMHYTRLLSSGDIQPTENDLQELALCLEQLHVWKPFFDRMARGKKRPSKDLENPPGGVFKWHRKRTPEQIEKERRNLEMLPARYVLFTAIASHEGWKNPKQQAKHKLMKEYNRSLSWVDSQLYRRKKTTGI